MNERKMRMRLGLFVAATLVTLGTLVVLFGSAPGMFSAKTRYTVLFPEAPGIANGTPIRKSGVRIGEVTKIELDPNSGQVRVQIAIDPKYPPRTSEEPNITRGFLSGDTAIDFLPEPGDADNNLRALIRAVRALLGLIRPTIDDIRGSVRRMEPELTGAAKSARNAFDRASTTFESVNEVLSPDNRKEFAELVKNL